MIVTEEQIKKLKYPMTLKWLVKRLLPNNEKPTHMVIVGYVDSRQVQDKFDSVVGPENWKDEYYECKGKQFCTISVKVGGEWVSKSDSGSASYMDPGKGETSDAFKRAAVKWGVNRDTYELGEITIACKVHNGIPAPCTESGEIISGYNILVECKRLADLRDPDLIFDNTCIPVKPSEPAVARTKTKRTPKSKIILP